MVLVNQDSKFKPDNMTQLKRFINGCNHIALSEIRKRKVDKGFLKVTISHVPLSYKAELVKGSEGYDFTVEGFIEYMRASRK